MKKFVNFTTAHSIKKLFNSVPFQNFGKRAALVLEKKNLFFQNFFQNQFQIKKQFFVEQEFSSRTKEFFPFWFELLNTQRGQLCTISGGQDSILNFFLLLHTSKKKYLQILYCQHFWQIKNFFTARFIFQISYLIKVPYTLILPQNILLNENESRDWRKQNFVRFSQIEHILTSFTGHTETDTLEKNLNNLFRGTSPAGVSCFSFLNSKKNVGRFFSSLNLNTCFSRKFEKTRHVSDSQELVTQKKNNKKKKQTLQNSINLNFISGDKNRVFFNERNKRNNKAANLSPKLSWLSESKITVSSNSSNLRNIRNSKRYNQQKTFQFCKIRKTFHSKKVWLNHYKNIFHFFENTKPLLNYHPNKKLKQRKSYSFYFSNQSLKMQIELIKPLEKIPRFSVSRLLKLYKLPILIDITNFSSAFSRNKIRHQLVPFLRSLIHLNVELLLTHFFKMIKYEHEDRKTEIDELRLIFKFVNSKHVKKINYFESNLKKLFLDESIVFNWNSLILKKNSTKRLLQTVSGNQTRSFIQKLFFEYKNVNLNYSQILKLDDFL